MQRRRSKFNHPRALSQSPPPGPARAAPEVRAHLARAVRGSPVGTDAWLQKPDVPTAAEVMSIITSRPGSSKVAIEGNKEKGGWESTTDYLKVQYNLLRIDTILPLVRAVGDVRASPYLTEGGSEEGAKIYDRVFLTGLTLAKGGFAVKVEFGISLVEKKVRWAQSPRLRSGTIVALSPAKDRFRSICAIAVVASRPLASVDVQPPRKPSIHLYFGDIAQLDVDPQLEWIMVEGSSGYWESSRHVLKALQSLSDESFPMSEHVVDVQAAVPTAGQLKNDPIMNLQDSFGEGFENVDVLRQWPDFVAERTQARGSSNIEPPQITSMDSSQMEALRRLLSKQLAIVQGPPGTGKTFVSVQALRALLRSWKEDDPPIVVTAHTNHALDQLLRHINAFEPNFFRLGGQSIDKDIITPRTLFNVGKAGSGPPSREYRQAKIAQKWFSNELADILQPLMISDPIPPELLRRYDLITQKQRDSFQKVERKWAGEMNGVDTPMGVFAEDHIVRFSTSVQQYAFNEYEEPDDDEKLSVVEEDLEAANASDKFENLNGQFYAFDNGWTTEREYDQSDVTVEKILAREQDVSKIPGHMRGAVYSYLQRALKIKIRDRVRKLALQYNTVTEDLKIAKWEMDHLTLKSARIIGVTTTGLSKYRGLITSLKPRIILIEEAAETLEAFVTAGCFPSLQQLLLVGDHQQLRPRTTMQEHAGNDINLDLSMFERLVNNGIEITQLKTQRRMRPEIRRLISPIYPELVDHPSVKLRERVRGMGTVSCHFFHHEVPERTDDSRSKQNHFEAQMIADFFEYLHKNEHPVRTITILTFYNGQKKLIRSFLSSKYPPQRLKIVTVDSYQGEENDILILSTVRNNRYGNIGFLSDVHRVCVALSRARRGLYIFGNGAMLSKANHKWCQIVLNVMAQHEQLEDFLPLYCENHGTLTEVQVPAEFVGLEGGCTRPCREILRCGHSCARNCHYISHDEIPCKSPCDAVLGCGHHCDASCGQEHRCRKCTHDRAYVLERGGRATSLIVDDPDLERTRREAAEWGGGPYAEPSQAPLLAPTPTPPPRTPPHRRPTDQAAREALRSPTPAPRRQRQTPPFVRAQRRNAFSQQGGVRPNTHGHDFAAQQRRADFQQAVQRSDQRLQDQKQQREQEQQKVSPRPNAGTVETLNVRDLNIGRSKAQPDEEDLIDFGEDSPRGRLGGNGTRKVYTDIFHT